MIPLNDLIQGAVFIYWDFRALFALKCKASRQKYTLRIEKSGQNRRFDQRFFPALSLELCCPFNHDYYEVQILPEESSVYAESNDLEV